MEHLTYGEAQLDSFVTVLQRLDLHAGQRFLDLGSGAGTLVILASLFGCESVGVEVVKHLYETSMVLLDRWEEGKKLPKNNYDPVVVATALAFNDAQTSKKLADTTREALDFMWTTQGKDGAWNWPKCGWAPMEIDDHYGVTLAALTTGIAPGNYVGTDAAKAGLARARAYLKDNPAPSLHHRTMIAWASLRVGGLMEEAARKSVLEEVFSKQLPDGGWSTPALLIDWKEFKRKDGKPHDPDTSDAYATGLAIVFAREMGIAAKDERLQNGIAWLKNNQRESGMWFTRSPSKDNKHYFTNFGCAFAILGLQSCGELPGWPFAGGRE